MSAALLSPASAWTEGQVYGVVGVIAYNETCEKLPSTMIVVAQEMKRTIPETTYTEVAASFFQAFVKLGKPAWCKQMKSIISESF